jgi:hypothetical protein
MDTGHFDTLTRSLLVQPKRRTLLIGMASGLLAALPFAPGLDPVAAKRHKKHKHKKKHGPPAATCSDGVKNGSETDVDCGGPDCPPCANGRLCTKNTDCGTARCGDGLGHGTTCQSCTGDGVCGSDNHGGCICNDSLGACLSDQAPVNIAGECPICPDGSVCVEFFEGFGCVPLCGG